MAVLLPGLRQQYRVDMVVVNGEKATLGLYLDGRVSIAVDTNDHVLMADHRTLPNGMHSWWI